MDINNNGKDDIQEVVDGVKSFLDAESTLISDAISNAAHWLEGIFAGVPNAVQAFVKNAIQEAAGDGNKPLGEVVADTLTIIYREGHDVEQEILDGARAIESAAIQAAVGLVTAIPKSLPKL